jgi:class 3 adenylate cyclase
MADPASVTSPKGTGHAAEERAVLFADVADSTRLFRELGDDGARAALVAALDLGRGEVEAAGGRVVEIIGDELFCELPDAAAGLRAAVGIHHAVGAARLRDDVPKSLSFRVGVAVGAVGHDGDKLYGDTVYLAKRVSTTAKAEQVLTTRDCLERLDQPGVLSVRTVDMIRLKGRVEEVELVEVVWSKDATFDVDAAPLATPVRPQGVLDVTYDGVVCPVSQDAPVLTIGRGETADLRIHDGRVSRLHASIELRRDGFCLVDVSRNGCLVSEGGEVERAVVRGVLGLGAAGRIRLGPDADAPEIHFELQGGES